MIPARVGHLLVAFAVAAVTLVGSAGGVQASCVAPEQRSPSPQVFTGVVVSTSLSGRVAVVRTDVGDEVVVRGTTASADNEATSADRAYVVGGRYEFHPLNTTSPFADNECTRTVLLGMVGLGGRPGLSWWWAGITAVVVLGGLGLLRQRGSRARRV
jgi:hypothetical protein